MKIHDATSTTKRVWEDDFWDNSKVIAETEKDIDFHNLLKINDKYYRIICAKPVEGQLDKYEKVAVEKVKYSPTCEETSNENYIVCPVCGHIDYDSFEVGEGEYICPACSSELDIETDYTVTYIATVKRESKIVNI